MGKILLFYKYVDVQDPQAVAAWQRSLCTELGLRGRIIVATEGINATLGGSDEATNEYVRQMNAHQLFGNIDFKTSPGDERFFPRLRVMIKKEIVIMGIDPAVLKASEAAPYVTPEEAHEILKNKSKDLVILDTRNDYEIEIGTFENAISPKTRYFREFPAYIDNNLETFADKEVLMFCTGGVRCERASAYLKNKRVAKKVMHIEGGIHRYVEKFPDGFFKGSNYVFDARVSDKINDVVLGACSQCSTPSDYYVNCRNAECNNQFLSCATCKNQLQESCSKECAVLVETQKVIVRTKPARIEDIIAQSSCAIGE